MKKLYFGGDIVTMSDEEAEAVLVENGRIKKIGKREEFEKEEKDEAVQKLDLHGQTLLPGFIDPHGHISMMGTMSVMANLREDESFSDIQKTLQAYIKDKKIEKGEVVVGFGYDHNFLQEARHPTKEILNEVSTEHPIFISHASGHVGCANDAALTLAGVDENTPEEEGGVIGRIEGSDEPNGYLEEGSMMTVQRQIAAGMEMDHVKLALLGQDIYLQNGITTAQDGATSHETLELFKDLAEKEKWKMDLVMYPTVVDNPEDMKVNEKYAKQYYHRLKIGGYKLFLDGSPQGKTAWMTEPYEGETTYRGYPWYQDEQVQEYVVKAINDNVQLLTHCNGDAASDQLLRNYEAALDESNNPNKHALRPVMIHCQTARNDQLDKMAELKMIPSIFNAHTYYWGDVHLKNLGDKRGRRISPARSAFDRNLVVNFHQDAPVVAPNMIQTIWSAVNRITRKGVEIGPEERVSVYEALQGVTINAAYAYFEENDKGSIETGKLADFVVLKENPLKVEKHKLKDIQVTETIKEGESVWQRK